MNTSKTPEEAAKPFVFSSPEGHALCRRILKEYLPYDPHNVQIEGFCKILDNIDLFAVLATGSGKTSFLSMYILVVLAIKKDPSLCPTANFPDNPCILVICPTKYLEHQMVGAFNRIPKRQNSFTAGKHHGEIRPPSISNQFRHDSGSKDMGRRLVEEGGDWAKSSVHGT